MTAQLIDLAELGALEPLHRKMRMGMHIGRHNEPTLWAQLEANADTYTRLFEALGYQLSVDPRGFAWLQDDEREEASEDQKVKKVRRFALILLALFDYQTSAGLSLEEFTLWHLDDQLLRQVLDEHRDLLAQVDVTSVQAMGDELRSVSNWGFTMATEGGWQLLPAVRRFTDTFKHLGEARQDPLETLDDEEIPV